MRIENADYNMRTNVLVLSVTFMVSAILGSETNRTVTIFGPNESNVVTEVTRIDPARQATNVTTRTQTFQSGRVILDTTVRTGAQNVHASRAYDKGNLVLFDAWDSESNTRQTTFSTAGRPVVTEVTTPNGKFTDLLIFHGTNEQDILFALQRVGHDLKVLSDSDLNELRIGAAAGAHALDRIKQEK